MAFQTKFRITCNTVLPDFCGLQQHKFCYDNVEMGNWKLVREDGARRGKTDGHGMLESGCGSVGA